ncbi:MAG: hypothetical protein BGO26_17460 [Actinobacteria bacterium 69-20]|nr:hypothetical protein [Actinomycetota bacterium]OJV26043.1 MAG: hypothetical protein BGO26_17460 [Actinobacteria bacterium 69-20]
MVDTAQLRRAIDSLLDAADVVTNAGDRRTPPPPGEWDADQILAHVSMVNAMTIATAYAVASGCSPTCDNRIAQDTWTIGRTIDRAGGTAGLVARIRGQCDALGALGRPVLGDSDLDTPIPTLLVSKGTLLVDMQIPLRELIAGLAEQEIPGHTRQLLALVETNPGSGSASIPHSV